MGEERIFGQVNCIFYCKRNGNLVGFSGVLVDYLVRIFGTNFRNEEKMDERVSF